MSPSRLLPALIALATLATLPAEAGLYRWIEADGTITFSKQPPTDGRAFDTLEADTDSAASTDAAPEPASDPVAESNTAPVDVRALAAARKPASAVAESAAGDPATAAGLDAAAAAISAATVRAANEPSLQAANPMINALATPETQPGSDAAEAVASALAIPSAMQAPVAPGNVEAARRARSPVASMEAGDPALLGEAPVDIAERVAALPVVEGIEPSPSDSASRQPQSATSLPKLSGLMPEGIWKADDVDASGMGATHIAQATMTSSEPDLIKSSKKSQQCNDLKKRVISLERRLTLELKAQDVDNTVLAMARYQDSIDRFCL